MEEEVFVRGYRTYPLTENVIEAIKELRDGNEVMPSRFSANEMNVIGLCYWYGHIVPLNYVEAVKWYQRAAEYKHRAAEFNLYICYSQATGVKMNIKEAIKWLKLSAKHNDARAQYMLAERYYTGNALRRNSYHAQRWFKRAERNAVAEEETVTLNLLGVRSLEGSLGAEKDKERAKYFFGIAAKLQFPLSILWLIQIYSDEDNTETRNYWIGEYVRCPYKITKPNVASKLISKPAEPQIKSELQKLAEMICHFDKGQIVIVASRPGVGKTSFATWLAKYVAIEQGISTAFFSLELSRRNLRDRLISTIANLDIKTIENELMSFVETDWQKYLDGEARLNASPLLIDDTPFLYDIEFEEIVRKMVVQNDIKMVIVDYLQLMNAVKRNEVRTLEYSDIAQSIRKLADDLNITIVLCSMLHNIKNNGYRRPSLSSFKRTGIPEKIANKIIFIHRPEYYAIIKDDSERKGLAEIILAKNNEGDTGRFFTTFDLKTVSFV